MIRQDIIDEIKMDLGHPTVKVELDASVWDKIIDKGLRWFKARKGLVGVATVTLSEGEAEYPWPADAYEIVDVVLPNASDLPQIVSLGFFDILPAAGIPMAGGGTSRFDATSYVEMLQALEQRRRIFGAEPDWYLQGLKVVVTGRMAGPMIIFFKRKTIDVPDLMGRDEDLIYRFCLAKAKMVLGEIRSKYPSYPAAGGAISMNGAELKAESMAELAVLEDEITESQGNGGGIVVG